MMLLIVVLTPFGSFTLKLVCERIVWRSVSQSLLAKKASARFPVCSQSAEQWISCTSVREAGEAEVV